MQTCFSFVLVFVNLRRFEYHVARRLDRDIPRAFDLYVFAAQNNRAIGLQS